MARAKRHFIPGLAWHITHRCHKREFLLKFSKDRNNWLYWLFQARKKYGLGILNYTVTSNHVHLVVFDRNKPNVISNSLHLVAGRTAQEYNQRKKRSGAFWEDRYHATAVETGMHLIQCMLYIDLNMVRAGVVQSPEEWPFGGYHEIQSHRQRYNLIDYTLLMRFIGTGDRQSLKILYKKWITEALESKCLKRENRWTQSIAVGSEGYIQNIKAKLGKRARGRKIRVNQGEFELREERGCYSAYFNL